MTRTRFGEVTTADLALFTDLYELTMMQGHLATDHDPTVTFDLFFRNMPSDRGYVVVAGLEQVVHYLETLSFDDAALAYLDEAGFSEEFLAALEAFEFTGDVRAVPEGTVVFPDEPMLSVTAPVSEAQLFETLLINQVGFQSLVATKAARMRDAVEREGTDQSLVDFGSRRAHGVDAGMKAARAAYVGGFEGTSNVAAGRAFDLPVFGTMAHSWVQSFETEREAFEAFVDVYGDRSILLVDTYDTLGGAETAMAVVQERDVDVEGVRLDSGDLVALSKEVSEVVGDVGIFVTSGIDEYVVEDFLTRGGVATGFGPGTSLVTSDDAPKLETVYKLVAVERDGVLEPSMKLSTGKATYPGQKSVRRVEAADGEFEYDVLDLRGEDGAGDELLVDVYEDGSLVYSPPDLDDVRARTLEQVQRLPRESRVLRTPSTYPVQVGDALRATTESVRDDLVARYRREG